MNRTVLDQGIDAARQHAKAFILVWCGVAIVVFAGLFFLPPKERWIAVVEIGAIADTGMRLTPTEEPLALADTFRLAILPAVAAQKESWKANQSDVVVRSPKLGRILRIEVNGAVPDAENFLRALVDGVVHNLAEKENFYFQMMRDKAQASRAHVAHLDAEMAGLVTREAALSEQVSGIQEALRSYDSVDREGLMRKSPSAFIALESERLQLTATLAELSNYLYVDLPRIRASKSQARIVEQRSLSESANMADSLPASRVQLAPVRILSARLPLVPRLFVVVALASLASLLAVMFLAGRDQQAG